MALVGAATLCSFVSQPASAASLLFDFEEFPAAGCCVAQYNSLLMTRGSLNIDISRTSGADFSIHDLAGFAPADWGSRSLSPFVNAGVNDGFLFDLSDAVSFFGIQSADFFADDDTVSLTAYDSLGGSGSIVDTDSYFWGGQGFPSVATVSTSSAVIRSVVATGGSSGFPNSMYWDNLRVETDGPVNDVPGPLPLLGVGAAFSFSRNFRKRIRSNKSPEVRSVIG